MKNFWLKIIVLIAVIVGLQVVIAKYVVPKFIGITLGIPGIAALDKYINNDYKIIYFGDSVIRTSTSTDKDQSSIVEMLSAVRPDDTIGDVSSSAYHLGIYDAMIEYISKSPKKPEVVVVPVNLRSFSPQWDLCPGYQFENEIFFLTHSKFLIYFSKPLSIFHAINIETVTNEQLLNTPVYYGTTSVGLAKDFEGQRSFEEPTAENIKNMYIYDYMYGLNPNHRKLESLRRAVDFALKSGVKIYVYVTPINYQGGTKYVGPDFVKQTKANADLVCSILRGKDLPCLNMVHDLDTNYFTHGDYPNEHLDEKGRKYVADKVNAFFLEK